MIYIVILLLLVCTVEIFVLRKGLKAANKHTGYLHGEQPSSVTASHPIHKEVHQHTADQLHELSDDMQEAPPLFSEHNGNIVTFPGGRSHKEKADIEHELRRPVPQKPREKSMVEMIQEIRGATPSEEIPVANAPSQAEPELLEEFEEIVEYEVTEEVDDIEGTEAHDNDVDEYAIDSQVDIPVTSEISGGQKDFEEVEEIVSSEELLKSGIRCVKQGNLDEGITTLEQAVEVTPDKAEAHFNLGIAYTLKELTSQAINAYQRAIELDPTYGKALFNLGTLYLKQGKLEHAIDNLEQAVKFLADPMKALWNLYEAYRCREHFSNALATLQQLVDLEPDDASLHNHVGICYVKLGEYKKAIASWKRSISLGASSLLIFYNLGKTYELCGDGSAAIEQYEQFLRLNTENSDWKELVDEVKERLESLQRENGKKDFSH